MALDSFFLSIQLLLGQVFGEILQCCSFLIVFGVVFDVALLDDNDDDDDGIYVWG